MSAEREILEVVGQMSKEHQARISACVQILRTTVAQFGGDGVIAIALLCAHLQELDEATHA